MRALLIAALLCLVALAGCKWRAIDGDTLESTISDDAPTFRLHGIDAPEADQTCRTWGRTWECGKAATAALESRTLEMRCSGSGTDRYGRTIGVCYEGIEDVNAWMVEQGWALAYRKYSKDYIPQEEAAKAAKRGIHRGQYIPTWDWRSGDRLEEGEGTYAGTATGDDDVGELADDLLWNKHVNFDGHLLDHSVFGLAEGGAVSFGDFRGATPEGIGRVVWTGQAIARDGNDVLFAGTAEVDIDDLAAPDVDVDVVLTEVRTVEMSWTDVPLNAGLFEAADGSMRGGFYGSGQEEVGGVFEQTGLTGAFGGTR